MTYHGGGNRREYWRISAHHLINLRRAEDACRMCDWAKAFATILTKSRKPCVNLQFRHGDVHPPNGKGKNARLIKQENGRPP